MPSDLVYFIDSGVTDDTTPPFTAIKAFVGNGLLNDKADQPSTSDTVWGHTPVDANYKYKAITGAVVPTDKSQTGVYGSDTVNQPLGYVLPLTAGNYTITSFHRDWWNNSSRTMDISLNYNDETGNPVKVPVRTGLIAGSDGVMVNYDFTLPADGTVKYIVNNTYTGNQAALISYLGVAKKVVYTPANKSVLQSNIAEAQSLTMSDYTVETWATLQNALSAAITVNNKVSATQDEVDAAAVALQTAISSLQAVQKVVKASLSVSDNVYTGQEFDVTYGLTSVTEAIYAQDLSIMYDPEKVEYLSSNTLNEGLKIVSESGIQANGMRLIVASLGSENAVNKDGDLIKLHFKAKSLTASTTTIIALANVLVSNAKGEETQLEGISHSAQITYVDRAALNSLISNAQNTHDSSTEGTSTGQYPLGTKAELQTAINSAQAVASSLTATQAEVDQAVANLNAALQAFLGSVITGTPGDVDGSGKVSIGDLAIVAKYYGKTSADEDWYLAKFADINNDKVIDISDLAAIARWILGIQ